MSKTEMKPSSPTPTPTPTPSNSSPDVINKAAIKLCHIVKRPDFDGYGFNLHSEKAKPGQFIGKVDANSPAEAANLKEGDRIIEVNGMAINNETHKQVVQRIKAIACEVRLLLIDVEGKGDGQLYNGQGVETSTTEKVLPGASENINSITMVTTKRPSQESQRSSETVPANGNSSSSKSNDMDVTDHQATMMMNNNHIPPPPSATMASHNKTMMNNNNNISSSSSTSPSISTSNGSSHLESATGNGIERGSGTIKAGSLQLPMTAAEMRAKLMMKKKYDPKNESVDLKKKYEIVQKL